MPAAPVTRPVRPAAPSPFHQLLSELNLRELVVIRVSAQALEALSSQTELGLRLHAAVPAVRDLGDRAKDLLTDSAEGERLRREYGVVTLHRRDASPYAESPGTVMGYAVPSGIGGLLLFVHDTAGRANVSVPHDPIPRVAFSELMIGLIAAHPSLEVVHFNQWERMVRSELEGQRIFEALRRHNVRLVIAGDVVDLLSDAGRLTAGIHGGTAAGDRNRIRRRTTVGLLNALHSADADRRPSWPYAEHLMPMGYGVVTDSDGKVLTHLGVGQTHWKLIAPACGEVEPLREVLRLVGAGRSWVECAEPLVRAKVRCRGGKWAGKTYDEMPRRKRGLSVKRFVAEHLDLFRTGRYVRVKEVPVPNDGTFEGFPVTPGHGTYGVVNIDVDLGLPEGGFVDETTSAKIEARLLSRDDKSGDRGGLCSLFAYLRPYRDSEGDDFTWERRLVRQGASYAVRQRAAEAAVDGRGKPQGWTTGEGDQILCVRRLDLESSVAEAVRRAVLEVAEERLVVHVRDRGPGDELGRLASQLRELECGAERARTEGETADRLAAIATAGSVPNDAAAARHMEAATRHYAKEADLRMRITGLHAALAAAHQIGEKQVAADLSSPAALAGCLTGYAGSDIPTEINEALRELGLDSLRLDVDPSNSRRVLWAMDLALSLEGGGVATIPVSGTVRNRRRDQDTRTTQLEVDAAIAQGFLKEGIAIESLCTSFGKDRNAVVTSLRDHLSRNGISKRGLRGAIVDLPAGMPETRLALWSIVSGDHESASHLSALREHLRRVYTSDLDHPNAWVRTDTTLVRKALAALSRAPGSGGDGTAVEALARAIGATRTQINTLCGDRGQTGSTKARFRGVLVRDERNPGIVRMRQCPHDDCGAARGYRWLSHYLPVPETDGCHGLICPSCHRLPDQGLSQLYLPTGYLQLWNGPTDAANFALGTRPATVASTARDYEPSAPLPRAGRLYNISEAAEHLGITNRALRGWILDDHHPLPAERLHGGGGLKYGLTQDVLDAATADPRVAELRKRSPRPAPIDTEYLTLKELSHLAGVAEHYLRRRALSGDLGPIEHRNLTSTGAAHLVVSRDVVQTQHPLEGTLLPSEWIKRHQDGLLLIGEAAQRTAQTASMIRDAVRRGELRSFVTDGGTHRFAPDELEAWAGPRREAALTPRAAAARAGVTTEALRLAAQRGALRVTKTAGGHARYREGDIDLWSSMQRKADRP